MKTRDIALPALLALLPLPACSTGAAEADERDFNLGGFREIQASAGVDVTLKQGAFAVNAENTRGDLDNLLLEVRGDTLVIGRKTSNFGWLTWSNDDFNVTVTAPEIIAIRASSGSDFEASNYNFRDLDVQSSSGADIDLAGVCTALTVDISSGADFNGEDLKCETVTVEASSGADADVFATRSASGDASSGADITVHGNPATIDKDTSSGGSVRAS